MSDRRPICDAMIVDGDRIAWLGKTSELSTVPSDSYELIDLDGQVVVPGFIDSHTHLVFWALSLKRIDLDGMTSYEGVLKAIKSFMTRQSQNEKSWIVGKGWKKEQWRQPRWPHKSDLDRVIPNRPAVMFSKDEHLLWVNSKALEVAGIDRLTPAPDGGEIDRDKSGEATGILRDKAMRLVYDLYRPPSSREVVPILEEGFAAMYRLGCVGVSSFDKIDAFETLQQLDLAGKLPVKVTYYMPVDYLDHAVKLHLKSGYGSEFLKIGGVKIFADGALGSQTALMLKPFKGSKSNRGIAVTSAPDLKNLVTESTKAGLACAIHAIGDLANRNVLDAFASCGRHVSARFRHRIEHCQIVAPNDIKRFAKLGVVASIQPSHATADIDLMKLYLGERQKDSYRMRTFTKLGVTQCYGSDAPIEPLNPLSGIYAAVVGKRVGGKICFNSKETVTVEQAVKGFTIGGARAVGKDKLRGNLEVGKKADFIVLDQDILRCPKEQIPQTKVVATFINGRLKYGQNGFLDYMDE